MQFPVLQTLQTSRDMQMKFHGYNHNHYLDHTQFYDMQNMSSSEYPALCPRRKRGIIRTIRTCNGLFEKGKLCWVDGTKFYYNGDHQPSWLVSDSAKQFVSMGAYILIWPDKKYLNTYTMEFGDLGHSFTTIGETSFTLCSIDGTAYENYVTADTEPSEPENGDYWVDTRSTPHVLKQYSSYSNAWVQVPTTYVKIGATGIGAGFKQNDGVTISGCEKAELNTNCIVQAADTDYIVVVGILDQSFIQQSAITAERKIPDMDFLTESENRVWGCSSANHEIYACKLGDPTNWNCFAGLSTDSYAVTVGTDGDFTGASTYLGTVLFFKENTIHKILGSRPANFQVSNIEGRGVEKGSEKSLVMVNEYLLYKGTDGIVMYDGSLPQSISDELGHVHYQNAVAGGVGNKYYVSMQDDAQQWHLFVYDQSRGMWHKEDRTHVTDFARVGTELYYMDAADNSLRSVYGTTGLYNDAQNPAKLEDEVQWFAQTGDIGIDSPDVKYISKIQIRLWMAMGASFEVLIQYDRNGEWRTACSLLNEREKRAFTIPIIPNRCDSMRIRFAGKGDCRVYSISKVMERGSEI